MCTGRPRPCPTSRDHRSWRAFQASDCAAAPKNLLQEPRAQEPIETLLPYHGADLSWRLSLVKPMMVLDDGRRRRDTEEYVSKRASVLGDQILWQCCRRTSARAARNGPSR